MQNLYLGIDGGQSSTVALIADETGQVLGRGIGGPCNHVAASEGRAKFISAVGGCLEQACRQANLNAASVSFRSACLGLSGGPEDKASFAREIIRSNRYKITHDAEIALVGATSGEPGIIIIAGTGSIAFGRNADGRCARAGGWGYIFGDEGGAFDLVRRALRAALKYEEGWGPETTLRDLLLQETGAANANEVLHLFYTLQFPRNKVASLAPLVTEAAGAGDQVATELVKSAAIDLAHYVKGVYRTLFSAEAAVPVAYIGAVFRSMLLLDAFTRSIADSLPCPVIAPRFDPAAGALLDAFRIDGKQVALFGLSNFLEKTTCKMKG